MLRAVIKVTICIVVFTLMKGAWAGECDKSNTNAEMIECAGGLYKKSDAVLNGVYKDVISKASPNVKAVLVEAQRKWIAFRDKHCEIYNAIYEGGSMAPLQNVMCLKDLTDIRTKELRSILGEIAR